MSKILGRKNSIEYETYDLLYYLKVIYRHRILIFALILFSIVITLVSGMMRPKLFQASATFFPLGIKEYYNPDFGLTAIKTQPDIKDLIISILESRKMANRIIDQLQLDKIWKKDHEVDVRTSLKGATKVSIGKNGIIELVVTTADPQLSARIANAYVDNLDYFNTELNIGAQRDLVQVIDRAEVPEKSIEYALRKDLFLSALFAIIVGVFVSFCLEYINRTNLFKRLKENA